MSSIQEVFTNIVKGLVRIGLWCYFKEIQVKNNSKAYHHDSVIYVGNHQNALIDALLIATNTKRKTTFLTRSDVFKNPFIGRLLKYLGMLPIYRYRDGVNTLHMNTPIFESCAKVLAAKESILIFPEGNHDLKRRVRRLKKGFVSILSHRWVLDKQPVLLYPIGLNYKAAAHFPDSVTLLFGSPIAVAPFQINALSAKNLLAQLHKVLRTLTTHIPTETEDRYHFIEQELINAGENFLDPSLVNDRIYNIVEGPNDSPKKAAVAKKMWWIPLLKPLFILLNLIPILVWRKGIKPQIKQKEFISTARFAFSIAFYPLYLFVISFFIAVISKNIGMALAIPIGLFLFNLLLVKKVI